MRTLTMMMTAALVLLLAPVGPAAAADAQPLKVATFYADVTPPVGSPLAYDPLEKVVMPLKAKGIVLIGEDKPIVLCAVDWIGIGNDGHKAWREGLAEAAGTTADRVTVHSLHQHDAPRCDFSANELLAEHGLDGAMFNVEFARKAIERTADAIKGGMTTPHTVTHLGLGEGRVEKVASNRRMLGSDGKVAQMRWTASRNEELRARPPGIIDPNVRLISFWNGDKPVAVLSYYATHPQSYYRTGGANPDFPGIARKMREEAVGAHHVHFTGAGGNIGAGKWNDGSEKYRRILAERLAAGMEKAWESTEKTPVTAENLGWRVEPVALPPADHLDEQQLASKVANEDAKPSSRTAAAKALAWLRRCKSGDKVGLGCLRLGEARILHMPGELAVEYQLAAQALRPDRFVAMAAYGDYAMGYISMAHHYWQGGYESSDRASRVAPSVETVLMRGMQTLLAE